MSAKSDRKKIVLTGASGGIGSEIAKALANSGFDLILTGRSLEKLERVKESIPGDQHLSLSLDLTSESDLNKLKKSAYELDVDGLINCLGENHLATLFQTDYSQINQMIQTNLVSPIGVCRVLAPIFRNKKTSFILNVGSILGSIGYAGSTVYCASKFGLRGFTESLRRELADTGIRVIYIAPRATKTALNSEAMDELNGKLGNAIDAPEYVAKKVLKAISKTTSSTAYLGMPEAFYVRLNSIFPSIVDGALSKKLSVIKQYCQLNNAK